MDSEDSNIKLRKQLIFRAWHRGTREMDLILGSFADQNVPDMSKEELDAFQALLKLSDPDLYNWYLGKEDIPANLHSPLMKKYLSHKVA